MTHQTVVLVACRRQRAWEIAMVKEGEGRRIGVITVQKDHIVDVAGVMGMLPAPPSFAGSNRSLRRRAP
jgi:hypothetical protein